MKQPSRFIVCVLLFCIVVIGGIARFYKLGEIPSGLTDDEVNAGYDAYSLLETGKDQWGTSYPIFSFKGFGDYRSPVYTYFILPLLPFMDTTPFWLRFPAACLGTITIFLVYFIAKRLGFSYRAALFASLFLALNPWHIGMSRTAMVIVTGVFFLCLGMMLLLYAKRRLLLIVLSSVFFGLTIYAYPAYLLLTPVVVGFLFFILFKEKNISRRQIATGVIIFIFIVAPYVFSSKSSSYGVRMGQVNIFRDSGTVDVLNEKLGVCQKIYPTLMCKVTYNRFTAFGMKFVTNYVRHFSPDLLFSTGTPTQYSVLPARGLLLSLEYVLFVIGVISLLFHIKQIVPVFLLVVLLVSPIPDTLTGDGHYGRYFVVIPFVQLVCAYGVGMMLNYVGRWAAVLLAGALFIESALFAVEYLTYYPYAYSRYSHYGYKDLSYRLSELKDRYDTVYVSGRVNDAKQYIFYVFYTKFDPGKFQTETDIEKIEEPNGWIRVRRIGNIYFVPTLPETDDVIRQEDKKILYIGAPQEFPKTYTPVQFTIRDKRGDILFEGITAYDWKRCLTINCKEDGKN